MAAEGLPVQAACRILGASEAGLLRLAEPTAFTEGHPPCLADRCHRRRPPRLTPDLRRTTGPCRAHSGPRHRRRPQRGRAAHAAGGDPGTLWASPLSPGPTRSHSCRSRGASVPPRRSGPSLGDRHHRAPDSRRQGLLRRGSRRLQPPHRRLVHRLESGDLTGYQRPRDGPREPGTVERCHSSQRSGHVNSPLGPSPVACSTRASFLRWDRWATVTTTP